MSTTPEDCQAAASDPTLLASKFGIPGVAMTFINVQGTCTYDPNAKPNVTAGAIQSSITPAGGSPSESTPAGADQPGAAGSGSPTTLSNPLGKGATIFTVIQRVISAFLGMVGALALLVFIYAGITWMTAGGEPKNVQKAKDAMKYAVIGIAMIAFAYVLTTFFINSLTGGA